MRIELKGAETGQSTTGYGATRSDVSVHQSQDRFQYHPSVSQKAAVPLIIQRELDLGRQNILHILLLHSIGGKDLIFAPEGQARRIRNPWAFLQYHGILRMQHLYVPFDL